MEATIRRAEEKDAQAIAEVHTASWRWAYEGVMSAEVLANLDVARRAAGWKQSLAADSDGRGWVAEVGETIVGFAFEGPAQGDQMPVGAAELLAIYLLQAHSGRGIGRALLQAVETQWRTDNRPSAVLRVAAANAGARAFYEANGWRLDGAMETHQVSATEHVKVVRYVRALAR